MARAARPYQQYWSNKLLVSISILGGLLRRFEVNGYGYDWNVFYVLYRARLISMYIPIYKDILKHFLILDKITICKRNSYFSVVIN